MDCIGSTGLLYLLRECRCEGRLGITIVGHYRAAVLRVVLYFIQYLSNLPECTARVGIGDRPKDSGRIVDKIGNFGHGIGVSVGISVCLANLDLALDEADEAMDDSKKTGKNQFKLYWAKPKLAWTA